MFNYKGFLTLLVLLTVGIIVYQYRYFRTPVISTEVLDTPIVLVNQRENEIPAITDPVYESIASADVYLSDIGYGIVAIVNSKARFYPFQILVWHEVVNDVLNGENILVTYCPLTYTSAVYQRETTTQPPVFSVYGSVFNSNTLLVDDQTSSLWSQATGKVIDGELIGASLKRLPSFVVTWSTFKTEFPFGSVLSRQTGQSRDYTQDPYDQRQYYSSQAIWFPLEHEDDRIPPKTIVYGFEGENQDISFSLDTIQESGTIVTEVDGMQLKIVWDNDLQTPLAFIGDEEQILQSAYWFSWFVQHPNSQIYSTNE